MSIGSPKTASIRNSYQIACGWGARRTAAAASKRFTTTSERSITPRLQKFGKRMPVPV